MTNETDAETRTALLLIAHGSRRPEANADLVRVAELVRVRRPDEIVEVSYLELAEPSIPAGGRRCVERGAAEVFMLPYFLSAGSHVSRDLERFRAEFEAEFPGVRFTVCPPLGVHPALVDVLLSRLQEAETLAVDDGSEPSKSEPGLPFEPASSVADV